jgi:selT/selW/selH-like putative selenoprotein
MEARIREEFPDATVELIASGGGVFEVTRDGELIYSKKRTGRHAEWQEVRTLLQKGREP